MTPVYFAIIAPDMVWQWYYNEHGDKHVKEIVGRDATAFITAIGPNSDSFKNCSLPHLVTPIHSLNT